VAEDVLAFLGGARGIEADDDGADRHHSPVEQDPLEPGARENCNAIAVAHAACQQALRQCRDALGRLVPRDGPPAVRRLLEIGGLIGRVADGVAPELGHRTAHAGIVERACRSFYDRTELRGPEIAISGALRAVLLGRLWGTEACVVRSRAAEAGTSAGSACG
jgi:hypothetical protein